MPLKDWLPSLSRPSMPRVSVGENRKRAVWRGLYGTAYYILLFIAGAVLAIVYGLAFVVDVLWQGATNRDSLAEGSILERGFDRQQRFREFLLFNEDEPPHRRWRR